MGLFGKKKKTETGEKTDDMGFFGHLEEMRSRIIYGLVGVILGCVVAGYFIDDIMNGILLGPAAESGMILQNLKPFGQPFLYFKIILTGGIILSVPFLLYQLWKFVAPGLYDSERKWVGSITFFTSLCFAGGVAFSYWVMIPSMLSFAETFGTEAIKNQIDVNEYFSFVTMMLLASGIVFEMPMVTYVLARFGLLTAGFMRKYRRHSIVVILIIAAVLTPTPDPISQLIFAAPLLILYEISIVIAKITQKKRDERDEAALREG